MRVIASLLVRPRAWWYNKVPLSVTLLLLLIDGRALSAGVVAAFALVVLTVCAVGNYGYALNELFDVDEDARSGRTNAAAALGPLRMWTIIGVSALLAEIFATAAAGVPGALLTLLELGLPLAYSVPPLRIKERTWLGVAADGLAAHVYPAVLALLAVAHLVLRPGTAVLAVSVVVWSAAAGLRGILSHQLHTAERDRTAGLTTVVHDLGHERLERAVVVVVLPLEAVAFGAALVACNGGAILWFGVALYLAYEAFKTLSGRFLVTAFRPQGQAYLPLVEESFYKAWGPLVLALDAARVDVAYVIVVAIYALLFGPHLQSETHRLRAVIAALSR
ncbi:MAG: UbiA family prenyltransferase [Candidatus Eremiobacteraeota bacterium]|nr:UbiA family prenyltransferase [Candidatus Eremiobacteraeota bacterium]